MRILLFGSDEKILQSGSDSQKRLAGYSSLAEQIYIVIFSSQQLPVQRIGNVFIYSSGGCCRFMALLKGCFLAKKIIHQSKIDVISTQDPFESAWVGWLLKKKTGIRLNIQIHGDFFSQNFWQRQKWLNFFRYYEAVWLLKKADSIRAVSERIKKSLIAQFRIPAEKIIVIPIYSDFLSPQSPTFAKAMAGKPDSLRNKKQGSGQFIFLTVSRLTKEKNLPMVLGAFSKLREGDKEAVLRVAGNGPEQKNLEDLAKKLKIKDKVQFLGWLNKEKLAEQYGIAHCFLLSSDFEGWGLAPLEAAYFGLPIVMTDVGCCGEIFQQQRDVLCSPPRDETSFLENMQRALDNEALRANLSQNAKAALTKLPSREQTMELYKKFWFVLT